MEALGLPSNRYIDDDWGEVCPVWGPEAGTLGCGGITLMLVHTWVHKHRTLPRLLPPLALPPFLPSLVPCCSAFEASVFFISVLLAIVVLQVRWETQPPVLVSFIHFNVRT